MSAAAIKVGDHDPEFVSLHPRSGNITFAHQKPNFAHGVEDTFETPSDGAIYASVSNKLAEATAPSGGLDIYIAGPMSGIKEFNFPAFFAAADLLIRLGHRVFNPAERDKSRHGGVDISIGMSGDIAELVSKHGFSLRDALRDDTHYICTTANAIAMLPGWEASKGARAEHALAFALGHQILYLGGFYA